MLTGMPLGLLKKVGNYRWTGGLGAEPPAGSLEPPGGGSRGLRPLEARAFSQSELPRKPPLDTHGRYTCIQYMHGGKKERKEKKKRKRKKKSESRKVWKSWNSDKSRKNGIPVLCILYLLSILIISKGPATTSSAILLVPFTIFLTIIFYYHISCYFMLGIMYLYL